MEEKDYGSGVQVISVDRDGDNALFNMDSDVLKKVLLQDHIKDLPIVVISIAGKFREGKSFFMNLVEGFLRNKEDNWLNPDNLLREGFEWEPGSSRCTSGIWISAEPVVVDGPNGEKVAVLLMDTQGTFDTTSSMKECSTIFALSTLLSNIQIYNLKDKFSRDDLEALQMFLEFGKAAQGQGQGNKPFKALKFLIRDWCAEVVYPHGAVGGEAFLQHHLQLQQSSNTLLGALGCFEMVGCFLLPVPWVDINCRADKQRSITDLCDEFKTHTTDLLASTLSWDNLQRLVKADLNGIEVTCKDVVSYVTAYVDVFNGDDLSVPQSAFEANLEISLTKAMTTSLIVFDDAIAKEMGNEGEDSPSLPVDALTAMMSSAEQKAVEYFEQTVAGINRREVCEKHREKLEAEIGLRIMSLINENSQKKIQEDHPHLLNEAAKKIEEANRWMKEVETRGIQEEEKQAVLISELMKEKLDVEKKTKEQHERCLQELKAAEVELDRVMRESAKRDEERIAQEMFEAEQKELRRQKKRDQKLWESRLVTARNVFICGGILSACFFAHRLWLRWSTESTLVEGWCFMGLPRAAWCGLGTCLASVVASVLISTTVRERQTSQSDSDSDSDSDFESDTESDYSQSKED